VYPELADRIRVLTGKTSREQKSGLVRRLAQEQATKRLLRVQLKAALADLAKVASVNARLMQEIRDLKAASNPKVRRLEV
jgi:hypothetical protein